MEFYMYFMVILRFPLALKVFLKNLVKKLYCMEKKA